MAFARLAFRVLLILLVLLIGIGLLLPSEKTVERSIVIDAAPAQVFPHLNSMRAFHAWSPWSDIDPATEYRFEGPASGVGARMVWQSGNREVGRGSQEIVDSVADRRVATRLQFGEHGGGDATFELEPDGAATRVRWTFHTAFGWDLFSRYVGLMLDSMIGASYDRGLRSLKTRIEGSEDGGGG